MLGYIKKKRKTIKKNQEGVTAIEMVIGVLIFIILLSFMMDILMLFWKFSVLSQTTTQVSRIASIQGGVRDKAPEYWASGDDYITIKKLNNMVQDKMDTANIETWNVKIDTGKVGTEGVSPTKEIDYKSSFEVTSTIEYKWSFVSNFVPGMDLTQTLTAKRPAMSEWKYDYNKWDGE